MTRVTDTPLRTPITGGEKIPVGGTGVKEHITPDELSTYIGGIVIDTKQNILSSTPSGKTSAFSSDTNEHFIFDGSDWYESSLQLKANPPSPDMGKTQQNDRLGYYEATITDKVFANCLVLGNSRSTRGALRTTEGGIFQHNDGTQWNDIVSGFRLREDENGNFEFEHRPEGFNDYIEVYTGNSSDSFGFNGLPLTQGYITSIGAYPQKQFIDGGEF